MRGELLTLLLLLAPLPAGAQSLSELCSVANAPSCPGYGTIGGGKPESGWGYEDKGPVCDSECQRRAAERHAAAYSNMLQIKPVAELDDVGIREGRTVKAALQADYQEHLAIMAFGTLYVGRTLISPWWALGSFAVVVLPHLHLERYVPVVTSSWDNWTLAAKKVDKGAKPKNCPTGTLPIDKDERIPREHHGKLKKQVGAGPADWTGITPDGRIITNDEKGEARDNGPYESFLP
ncbi:MAG: hypothetical protein HYV14_11325 [Elusimicrobia bacterium]|nr:hypothetical protein [Elusimicrobiota bacterium]